MKIFKYHVCWRFSSENFCYGLVWANSEEEAKEKLTKQYPNKIGLDITELIKPDDDVEEIYDH